MNLSERFGISKFNGFDLSRLEQPDEFQLHLLHALSTDCQSLYKSRGALAVSRAMRIISEQIRSGVKSKDINEILEALKENGADFSLASSCKLSQIFLKTGAAKNGIFRFAVMLLAGNPDGAIKKIDLHSGFNLDVLEVPVRQEKLIINIMTSKNGDTTISDLSDVYRFHSLNILARLTMEQINAARQRVNPKLLETAFDVGAREMLQKANAHFSEVFEGKAGFDDPRLARFAL